MKVTLMLLTPIFTVFLFGCSSKTINNLSPRNGDGVVVYKASVNYKGEDVTERSGLFFNGEHFGISNKRDELILVSLPVGENYISMLTYHIGGIKGIVEKKFDLTSTKFNVDPSRVTYLGDLTIDWNGADESIGLGESIGWGGGVVGALIASEASKAEEGVATIKAVNSIDDTKSYLERKFNKPVHVVFFPLGKQDESK